MNSLVVGVCQSFQFFKQKAWFLENNTALPEFLYLDFTLLNWFYQTIIKSVHKDNFILPMRATLSHYSDHLLLYRFILCTVANNEVSSANSFLLQWRTSTKSLIHIRRKGGPETLLVEHRQEHDSRTNNDHLEKLFVSAILWNLLKLSKEVHWSHFALIHEGGFYARLHQMPLKYLKMPHILHSLDLEIDKYHVLLTKAD